MRRRDADEWAIMMERRIDCGESTSKTRPKHIRTVGDLVDLHIVDMRDAKKPLRRSKAYSLEKIRIWSAPLRQSSSDQSQPIGPGKVKAAQHWLNVPIGMSFPGCPQLLSSCQNQSGLFHFEKRRGRQVWSIGLMQRIMLVPMLTLQAP